MPSTAFIEDDTHRVSLFSAQSLGVASLEKGWLEIVQDRRLMQDDNRGVGQGVKDNKRTPTRFRLLIEPRADSNNQVPVQPMGYTSAQAYLSSLETAHSVVIIPKKAQVSVPTLRDQMQLVGENLPCDLHVVNIRTLQTEEKQPTDFRPSDEAALLLHRTAVDCSFELQGVSCQTNNAKVSAHPKLYSRNCYQVSWYVSFASRPASTTCSNISTWKTSPQPV